jgi:tetratricopeptide (TPR) repeat protein
MLTREPADEDFAALKTLLTERQPEFSHRILNDLYQYAINYCNLQIMKVQERYVGEALALYRRAVQAGIFLEHGRLSPWHYKNIIKLALRLREYDWTETFIREFTALLPPEDREDAFHFNLAELYYYKGRYDEAMQELNRIEFSDVHYNLGAKVLLAKIYYELQATDALESLLHAFKIFLHRNRVISEDLRRTYLNFIALLHKIVHATPERRPALRQRIEKTPLLTGKNWLVRIAGEG